MPKRRRSTRKLRIDQRADRVAAAAKGSDDDLLTTSELAALWGVRVQWLKLLRSRGDGPEYERLGPRLIRYRRGKANRWSDDRSYKKTSEYGR